MNTQAIILYNEFENYYVEITAASPGEQWPPWLFRDWALREGGFIGRKHVSDSGDSGHHKSEHNAYKDRFGAHLGDKMNYRVSLALIVMS